MLNRKQKIEVLQNCLEDLYENETRFVCYQINEWAWKLYDVNGVWEYLIPEWGDEKPSCAGLHDPWWPLGQNDQRIKAIKNCINRLKK